jgi:hypothetical protein
VVVRGGQRVVAAVGKSVVWRFHGGF